MVRKVNGLQAKGLQLKGLAGEGAWRGGVAGKRAWRGRGCRGRALDMSIACRRGAHVHHVEQHRGGEEHPAPAVVEEVLVDEPQAEGEERRADEREELG